MACWEEGAEAGPSLLGTQAEFRRTIARAAVLGLAMAAAGCEAGCRSSEPGVPVGSSLPEPAGDKNCCMGLNDCKGKGGCAVPESHACKGQNVCAGRGGCSVRDCPAK